MELSCLVPYTGFLDILMLSLVVMELSCPVPYTGFLDVSMSSASSFPEPGMRRLYVYLMEPLIHALFSAGLPGLLFLLMQQAIATADTPITVHGYEKPNPNPYSWMGSGLPWTKLAVNWV